MPMPMQMPLPMYVFALNSFVSDRIIFELFLLLIARFCAVAVVAVANNGFVS